MNRDLRRAYFDGVDLPASPRRLTVEQKQRLAERQRQEQIRLRARNSRERILSRWAWPYARIAAQSPVRQTFVASLVHRLDFGAHLDMILSR